jgi:hypothetical protein
MRHLALGPDAETSVAAIRAIGISAGRASILPSWDRADVVAVAS